MLILKQGITGHKDEVIALQKLLNARLIPSPNLNPDGNFGPKTDEAVRRFQKQAGLTDDGIVGPKTWTALGQPLPKSGNVAAGLPNEITIEGADKISAKAQRVLKEILQSAGLRKAKVTSGTRNAYDQARVMYDNIKSHGVAHQKNLYGSNGDKVIDVYSANTSKTRDEVIALMKQKIEDIGPSKVSKHCSSTHDVFDVAPSSIADHAKFEKALKENKEVSKYILPPTDPAYHLEIPK